jgi:ribosome-associated protein
LKTKPTKTPVKTKAKAIPSLPDVAVELIQDKKGNDIVCLDLTKIPEAVTDYFIICDCPSTTQTRAIVDHLEHEIRKRLHIKALRVEGRSTGEWCLIDFGELVVHVFVKEKREFYQLEDLWHDAKIKRYVA